MLRQKPALLYWLHEELFDNLQLAEVGLLAVNDLRNGLRRNPTILAVFRIRIESAALVKKANVNNKAEAKHKRYLFLSQNVCRSD